MNTQAQPVSKSGPEFDEFFERGGLELRHYWYVLVRYKWGILGLVLSIGLLTTVLAYSMQPVYKSTATLMIGGGEHLLGSDTGADSKSWSAQEQFYSTQYELLKSREIAQAALEQLNLEEKPWLNPLEDGGGAGFDWQSWVPQSWLEAMGMEHTQFAESDPNRELLRWLSENLSVSAVRDTSMVKVSFDSPNRSLAAMVANAVASAYIETNIKQRVESTGEASDWLKEQLLKSQQSVAESVESLQRYREEAGLLDVDGMQSVYSEQLRMLAGDISEANRARMEAESLLRRAQSLQTEGQLNSLPAVFNNPWIQRLKQQEEELEREIKMDSERFQGDYPGLDEAEKRLNTLRNQIKAAFAQLVDGLRSDYEVAVTNEKQLQEKLALLEEKVQEMSAKEFQSQALEQVVLTNRQSYDAFLTKLMETTTRGSDTISMIARVVDPAVPEERPYKPQKLRMITVAVVLALLAGVGLAFLLDRLDNTLKSREDVEERLGLPVIGELIQIKTKKSRDDKDKTDPVASEFRDNPKSGFSEAIRTIRTGVALSGLEESENQLLVITSTVSSEGKSTTAINLAYSMSDLGNVLLIDADLRRPAVARKTGLDSNSKGLTDLVAGTAKVSECIHKVPGGIHVMPAGSSLPPDPIPLLSSERFSELLRKISTAYDTVIVDSAPVELVSDTRVLATHSTGVIYIVKADETPVQAVKQGLNSLKQSESHVIGIVLNQIDPSKAESYGKYKYGYNRYAHYGYGEKA